VDNSEPVAKRRGPQTHSCWSADSSFPPKPPPPTGGCRAQYDRPQSAYLPAQGTGHPTLVGFSSEGDSPRTPGGLLLKSRTEIYLQRYLRVRKGFQSPLSQIVRRGTGWGSTPSIFLAGSAALPWRPLAHDVLPRSYPRLGVGVIRFPHTWDGPRLGVSAHERAATIPAIFFHTECNPPRLGPITRPAPLPTWCTPLTRGLT
jgi:hypothetical protein